MPYSSNTGPDSETAVRHRMVLEERIREKIADYAYYKFTVRQTRALNIFFDLAQEYEDLLYLYHLPVQVLQFFFNLKAELYARDDSGAFVVQTPKAGPEVPLPTLAELSLGPRQALPAPGDAQDGASGWWFFPVKGRPGVSGKVRGEDAAARNASQPRPDEQEILAILAIVPQSPLTGHEKLFYEKFANRLGFCLHNRILALKNLEHIEFVRTLVHDIGHNVIVPNMHFKLLMRQMADKIAALRRLSDFILGGDKEDEVESLHSLFDRIDEHYEEISRHFHQSSFFLETLLRQSHFDQGRYVLQCTVFNLLSRVIAPQLERYRQRFQERDITLTEEYDADTAPLQVNGDIGLLSQVLANVLSNAVKYTRQAPGEEGLRARCAVHVVPDFFGAGRDGVRVEVFSTGLPIPQHEAEQLFGENFRASNAGNEQGTGHGLYFSRLIITQHGGECGYLGSATGNTFYLILPRCHPERDGDGQGQC